jgi:hypothetical protein
MKRRRWLALIVLSLACIVVVVLLTRPASVEERAGRVRKGMTRAEVMEAVGEPPGNYARVTSWAHIGEGPPEFHQGWYWDDGMLSVWYDDDDRVRHSLFGKNPDPPSALSIWRRRLGL